MHNHFHTWICILCITCSYTCFAQEFTVTNTAEWQKATAQVASGDSIIVSGAVILPAGVTVFKHPIEITTSNDGILVFPQTAMLQFDGQSELPGEESTLAHKISYVHFEAETPSASPSYFIQTQPGSTIQIGAVHTNSQGGFIEDLGADYIHIAGCKLKHTNVAQVILSTNTHFIEVESTSFELDSPGKAFLITQECTPKDFLTKALAARAKKNGGTQSPIIRLYALDGKVISGGPDFSFLEFNDKTWPGTQELATILAAEPNFLKSDPMVIAGEQLTLEAVTKLPLFEPVIDIQQCCVTTARTCGNLVVHGALTYDQTFASVSVFLKDNRTKTPGTRFLIWTYRGPLTNVTIPAATTNIQAIFTGVPADEAPTDLGDPNTRLKARFVKNQAELDMITSAANAGTLPPVLLLYPTTYTSLKMPAGASNLVGVPISGKFPRCTLESTKNVIADHPTATPFLQTPFCIVGVDLFNKEEKEQPLFSCFRAFIKDSTITTTRNVLEIQSNITLDNSYTCFGEAAPPPPETSSALPWRAAAILSNVSCYFLPSADKSNPRYFIKTPSSLLTELQVTDSCVRNTEKDMATYAFHISPGTNVQLLRSIIDIGYLIRQTEGSPFMLQGHDLYTSPQGALYGTLAPAISSTLVLGNCLIHTEKAVMELAAPSTKNDMPARKQNSENFYSSFVSIPDIQSGNSLIEIGNGEESLGIVKIVPSAYFHSNVLPLFSSGSVTSFLPICHFAVQDPLLPYVENGEFMTSKEVPFLVYLSTKWADLIPQIDPLKVAKDLGISIKVGDAFLPAWHQCAEVQPWVQKVLAGESALPPMPKVDDNTSKITKNFLTKGNVYKNESLQTNCDRGLSTSGIATHPATNVKELSTVSLTDDNLNVPLGAAIFTKEPLVSQHGSESPFVSGDFSRKYRISWKYTAPEEVLYFGLFFDSTLLKKVSFVPGKTNYEIYIKKTEAVIKNKDRFHIRAVLK